jgi:hypothetical protein
LDKKLTSGGFPRDSGAAGEPRADAKGALSASLCVQPTSQPNSTFSASSVSAQAPSFLKGVGKGAKLIVIVVVVVESVGK